MSMRPILRYLLLLAITAALPSLARACWCYPGEPRPCQLQQLQKDAKTIFVGKVLSIENPPPEPGANADRTGIARYHFAVNEAFAGVNTAEVDVYSGRGGGDCSYHFREGETYLVYSSVDSDHALHVSMCSNTRPAEQAAALLQQLRNARDWLPVASVFGTVRREQNKFPGAVIPGADGAMQNVVVRMMSSDGRMFTAQTDELGRYAFYNLPPGMYGFTANIRAYTDPQLARERPGFISYSPIEDPIKIPGGYPELMQLESGACHERDLRDTFPGKIRVRVIRPDGEPAQGQLSLFAAEQYALKGGRTRPMQGIEKFENLAPGEYIVVFNNDDGTGGDLFHRTFYPDSRDLEHAVRINVRDRQAAEVTLQLRDPIVVRPLVVKLAWQGEPPPNMPLFVTVRSNTPDYTFVERIEPGVFTADIRTDIPYAVQGESYCGPFRPVATQTVVIEGDALLKEVVLTLPRSLCGGER